MSREDISEFERARVDMVKDNRQVTPELMLRLALHDLRKGIVMADGMLLYLFDKAGDGRYGSRQVYIANMDRVEEIAYLEYCKLRSLQDWQNS